MDKQKRKKKRASKFKKIDMNAQVLGVFKSNRYFYAYLLDRKTGKIITSLSTYHLINRERRGMVNKKRKKVTLTNDQVVKKFAQKMGEKLKKMGILKFIPSSSGYVYSRKLNIFFSTISKSLNFVRNKKVDR